MTTEQQDEYRDRVFAPDAARTGPLALLLIGLLVVVAGVVVAWGVAR